MSRTLDVSSVITLPLLGQSVDFHIKKIIGVGGSCIAYEVVYSESNSITHKCILKEFCPVYLDNGTSPVRDGQRILVPDEYREKYNEDLD